MSRNLDKRVQKMSAHQKALEKEKRIKKILFWIILAIITVAPFVQNFGYITKTLFGL